MQNIPDSKVPYLDGWRGLAILGVLAAHFGPKSFAGLGNFGVLLFFVLSGFFMSQLLFIRQVDLPTFFVRRFSRVLPTFWLFTCTMALYALAWQPVPYQVPAGELAATLLFVRTYFPSNVSIWADKWPIGHFWSLNIEEHSYVFLAIGAVLCARYRRVLAARWFLIGSVGLSLAIFVLYALRHPAGASPWYLRSECASLGLLASAAYRVWLHETKHVGRRERPVLGLLAFVASGLCFAPVAPVGLDKTLAPLLAAFAINHVHEAPVLVRRVLSFAVLRWFGLCSFSIYLWQMPSYLRVKMHGGSPPLCLAIALVLGAASFYLFENPLRVYLNQRWTQRKGARHAVTA
jgi:peptidoglycan/LPS O-acetylase OafA/YrhL